MSDSTGRVLLGVLALGIVVSGFYQIVKGYQRKFLEELNLSELQPQTRKGLTKFGQSGYIARGAVFVVAGGALAIAVSKGDPSEAKSFGEALGEIATQPYGMVLLALVALGLLAYGVFLLLSAKYRRLGNV
jgi:hypothetical protein